MKGLTLIYGEKAHGQEGEFCDACDYQDAVFLIENVRPVKD